MFGLSTSTFSPPVLGIFPIQICLGAIAVGFTTQRSMFRLASLPLVSSCVYTIITNASKQMRPSWTGLVGGLSFVFYLQYIDVVLLSRWSFETHAPEREPKPGIDTNRATTALGSNPAINGHDKREDSREVSQVSHGTFWNRLSFGWDTMMAFRHVNTPYEIPHIPPFSRTDPTYVPSRWRFVAQHTLTATACYLVLDLMGSRPPPTNNADLFNADLIPIFSRLDQVTLAQLTLRTFSTVGFAVTFFCIVQGVFSTMAVPAVALGLSDVRNWRPVFGSLSETYTLRSFWGKFWHQALRRGITAPALFISDSVLHLPRHTTLHRYTTLLLSFLVSGIMHVSAGLSSGRPFHDVGVDTTLRFFCTQALGVVVEDSVVRVYRWLLSGRDERATSSSSSSSTSTSTSTSSSSSTVSGWLTKCTGYVWLTSFMIWSAPVFIYPQAARPPPPLDQGPRGLVPFSVVAALKGGG